MEQVQKMNLKIDECLKSVLKIEAWKKVSENDEISWTIELLQKNSDNLNWSQLCKNEHINWTIAMLAEFESRIDWEALSEVVIGGRYYHRFETDWNMIRQFKDKWNWHKLSECSGSIPEKIIVEFADNWDWRKLIDHKLIVWTKSLYKKVESYIPFQEIEELLDSKLWEQLVEYEAKVITGKILDDEGI